MSLHEDKVSGWQSLWDRFAYKILACFILLVGMLVASASHVLANPNAEPAEAGRAAFLPGISGDRLTNVDVFAFPDRGAAVSLSKQATRTPRPTSTPPTIPPPPSPTSNSVMIFLGALVMAVILAGIWINRRRAF